MGKLTGTSLAGGSVNYERVENDFYATDPQSTIALLEIANISGNSFYEPCCGAGHISEVLLDYFPDATHICSDLVDRGYCDGNTLDFIKDAPIVDKVDWIITNPPYN